MGRKATSRGEWDSQAWLYQKYIVEGLGTKTIATLVGTFPNTVRRSLHKHSIPLRDKSEAQSTYLEREAHPMLGRERTEEEKRKISDGIQKNWDGMTEEERQSAKEKLSANGKAKWEWMSEEERSSMITKMHRANRKKSGAGSKNENMVASLLREAGYKLTQRTTDFVPDGQFEIDIAMPGRAIAIEWDGAAHFAPIYGDKSLARSLEKDKRKDAVLLQMGWTVVRCRDHSTSNSLAFCKRAVSAIIEVIENGKKGVVHYIDAN